MKKSIGLFLGLLFCLAGCSAPIGGIPGGGLIGGTEAVNQAQEENKELKIGIDLELSGAVASYGQQQMEGIRLAVKELNAKGGIKGKKIKLIKKDNKSDTSEAVSIASSLTTKDQVVGIVGGVTSSSSKAIIPNITKAKIPAITPSGTDDSITVLNGQVQPYMFRTSFQNSFQGVVLANYAMNSLQAKKAVIIADVSSDYVKGLTKAFKDTFQGEIVADEKFNQKDKDFRAILTKLREQDFDFIYLPSYYEEAGLIVKQAREMGIKQPILGGDGFSDEKMVTIAGEENMSNIFYTTHFSESAPSSARVPDFIVSFKKTYGKNPSAFNALAYDSIYMMAAALKNSDKLNSQELTKGLEKLKDFEGVTGIMTMDENHNPRKPAVVIGLEKGKQVSAESVNP